jgi:hypothetical protein
LKNGTVNNWAIPSVPETTTVPPAVSDMATDRRASALLRYCLRLWREGLSECIGLDHHLVNVVALRALKRADIETHTCRRDASEHHVSAALWASRTMEVKVDIVRQEIGFLHDAFLVEEATLLWRD